MARPKHDRRHRPLPGGEISADRLREALRERQIVLDDRKERRLRAYAGMLREWGQRTNLAGPAVLADPVPSLVEALEPLRAGFVPPGPLLDIGSGGGLPGIPLAIGLDLPVTLIEPRERRWAFLHRVLRELELPGEAVAARWEDLAARTFAVPFGAISSRALAGAGDWAVALRPLLAPGGYLFLFTGGEAAKGPIPFGFEDAGLFPSASPGHFLRVARRA